MLLRLPQGSTARHRDWLMLAHTRLREVSGGGAPTPSGTCVWFD